MNTRIAAIRVSLIATLMLTATTGCGADVNAKTELANATAKLSTSSFKVTLDMADDRLTGTVDAPNRNADLTMVHGRDDEDMRVRYLIFDTDVYMNVALKFESASGNPTLPGMSPDRWIRFDVSKLPQPNTLGMNADRIDPAATDVLIKAIVTAQRSDARSYTGTMDLGKAVGAAYITRQDVTELGEKANAVPFKAAIDTDGRLTSLAIDIPPIAEKPAYTLTATFTDFGTTINISKPAAGQTTGATTMEYSVLEV